MDLKGTIGFEYELAGEIAEGPIHQHLKLRASRCWLRYDRFPYAISNVRGELEMIDGNWWFRNLDGYNGTSRVSGEGTLVRTPQGDELVLRLHAANVPLEGELRDALQPGMRQSLGPAPAAGNHRSHGQRPLPRPARSPGRHGPRRTAERNLFAGTGPLPLSPRERARRLHLWQRACDFRTVQRVAWPRENGLQRNVQLPARRRLAASHGSSLGRSSADGPAVHAGPAAAAQEGAGRAQRHGPHEPARQTSFWPRAPIRRSR